MSKRILIIDDSPLVLKLAKSALESCSYEVQTMSDPGSFDPTNGQAPDLILVDINMPEFFGDDVVSYFKEEWSLTTPIYLYSTVAEPELQARAAACGAQGYVSKNWGLEKMVTAVQTILGDLA